MLKFGMGENFVRKLQLIFDAYIDPRLLFSSASVMRILFTRRTSTPRGQQSTRKKKVKVLPETIVEIFTPVFTQSKVLLLTESKVLC
jgi:hypothetical protein